MLSVWKPRRSAGCGHIEFDQFFRVTSLVTRFSQVGHLKNQLSVPSCRTTHPSAVSAYDGWRGRMRDEGMILFKCPPTDIGFTKLVTLKTWSNSMWAHPVDRRGLPDAEHEASEVNDLTAPPTPCRTSATA